MVTTLSKKHTGLFSLVFNNLMWANKRSFVSLSGCNVGISLARVQCMCLCCLQGALDGGLMLFRVFRLYPSKDPVVEG